MSYAMPDAILGMAAEAKMRVIGKRRVPEIGMRGPTEAEIEASVDNSRRAPRVIRKGVYRYRSHEEANADMERWTVDGMVERSLELARGPR
ncbi:hypothetical protein [uncultured Bosea sp.]|uniref:hypothetical protein n=1 Tax=uncultured Bosea sp. TaxID=211457 RepID=UPI0025EA6F29|nr:hypothetical protein [uncultured Bosea sp.]